MNIDVGGALQNDHVEVNVRVQIFFFSCLSTNNLMNAPIGTSAGGLKKISFKLHDSDHLELISFLPYALSLGILRLIVWLQIWLQFSQLNLRGEAERRRAVMPCRCSEDSNFNASSQET